LPEPESGESSITGAASGWLKLSLGPRKFFVIVGLLQTAGNPVNNFDYVTEFSVRFTG
jgi:hypothetical protein